MNTNLQPTLTVLHGVYASLEKVSHASNTCILHLTAYGSHTAVDLTNYKKEYDISDA